MKNIIVPALWVLAAYCVGTLAFAEKQAPKQYGEAEFKEHCAICHAEGGNIINPKKTLHKKVLDANAVKTEADIIKIMRKPGPGMTTFDEKTLPNEEAEEIAKYIIKTFK